MSSSAHCSSWLRWSLSLLSPSPCTLSSRPESQSEGVAPEGPTPTPPRTKIAPTQNILQLPRAGSETCCGSFSEGLLDRKFDFIVRSGNINGDHIMVVEIYSFTSFLILTALLLRRQSAQLSTTKSAQENRPGITFSRKSL